MTNPDWNSQVKIGRSNACIADTGAHHRAIEIARQLLAIGRWPDHRVCSGYAQKFTKPRQKRPLEIAKTK